jgi:dihydroorotate dehydrogenase
VSWYRSVARPVLFRLGGGDAEVAHERTLRGLSRLPRMAGRRPHSPAGARRTVFGVDFPNPVGLAAGMDKDGRALAAWPVLGFGFVEVGTVTWHAQPGNERPRLFRLPEHEAIINRMGFNNGGAVALAGRLRALDALSVPLGISLGKSKVTPLADAVEDYVASLRVLYANGDYFAINVSSPNTPGLRELQDRAQLTELLGALRHEAAALAAAHGPAAHGRAVHGPAVHASAVHASAPAVAGRVKPLLVKVAPDLGDAALGELLDVCLDHGVAGLIATNTTIERPGLPASSPGGGLSGRPLASRALEVVRFVVKESGLPVIGVGGITDPADAVRLVDAGASLVQLYTGLIYRGPGLVRGCVRALRSVR